MFQFVVKYGPEYSKHGWNAGIADGSWPTPLGSLYSTPQVYSIPARGRGITGIFFWGGKVIFPDFFPGMKCFFPVENFHFGRPKNKFLSFSKVKSKKKKKKKSSALFITFPTSILQFYFFSSLGAPVTPLVRGFGKIHLVVLACNVETRCDVTSILKVG